MKNLRRTPFFPYLVLPILLLCFACQSGKIPCPHIKAPRAKRTNISKRNLQYASARREQDEGEESRNQAAGGRGQDPHFIKSVSLEEWDCPHPGEKRYMPKSVKNNIRRNLQRINGEERKGDAAADSTRYNR
jgi:hypothetical protein